VEVEVVDRRGTRSRRSRRHHKHCTAEEGVDGDDVESPLTVPPPSPARVASPRAPRASPEPSEVDPVSSPRWPRGSLATPPGSAGDSPPLPGAPSLIVPRLSTGSTTAERQDDLDYFNSLRLTHANADKGTGCGRAERK